MNMMREEPEMLKVGVLDMQPIDPPVGGGRIRLLGLYHNLGEKLSTTYLGTYDWPGPEYRKHKLSDSLVEINVPLSADHFKLVEKWNKLADGTNVIDTAFPLMAGVSTDYVEAAKTLVRESDIVIFSHPWVYPLVRSEIDSRRKLVVYDSHNVEGILRASLLDDASFGTEIVKTVILNEFELSHRADFIVACSEEDCEYYADIYAIERDKLSVIPNGVFAQKIVPPTAEQKKAAKKMVECTGSTAIFLASNYGPNVEAVQFVIKQLAPLLPQVTFLICGGVSQADEFQRDPSQIPGNVRMAGFIPEEEKLAYLWAADLALNPMFSGSGTNIKMFDFMSAGLPVITTEIGARGISCTLSSGEPTIHVAESGMFGQAIDNVLHDKALYQRLSAAGRTLVENEFSWENISPYYGDKVTKLYHTKKWSANSESSNLKHADDIAEHDHNALKNMSGTSVAVKGSPVVGTFADGEETARLIEAIAILRDIYPDIVLLCIMDQDGREESHERARLGRQAAERLNLVDNTVFCAAEKWLDDGVVDSLRQCDIIVLPSDSLAESASPFLAAAAAKRPIIMGCDNNFLDFQDRVYKVESTAPGALAVAIANIITFPFLAAQLQESRRTDGCQDSREGLVT